MIERTLSPQEAAELLKLSTSKIRRLFQSEPGVIRIGEPSKRLGSKLKRRYFTLRIPESVYRRVVARMQVKPK